MQKITTILWLIVKIKIRTLACYIYATHPSAVSTNTHREEEKEGNRYRDKSERQRNILQTMIMIMQIFCGFAFHIFYHFYIFFVFVKQLYSYVLKLAPVICGGFRVERMASRKL